MTTREIADAFATLCREGRFEEAGERFWSDQIVSIEAMPGEMQRVAGRAAVVAKGEWWSANHEIHSAETHGPYVNGEQFALRFVLDVTRKEDGMRLAMDEVGLYTVRDGRVVEERFFY